MTGPHIYTLGINVMTVTLRFNTYKFRFSFRTFELIVYDNRYIYLAPHTGNPKYPVCTIFVIEKLTWQQLITIGSFA